MFSFTVTEDALKYDADKLFYFIFEFLTSLLTVKLKYYRYVQNIRLDLLHSGIKTMFFRSYHAIPNEEKHIEHLWQQRSIYREIYWTFKHISLLKISVLQ